MKKQIGPRIPESAHDWYAANFATANAGASYILEAFPALYRATLVRELRGKLTKPELMLILDACNGLILTSKFAGQHLILEVTDGIELNGLDEKWDVYDAALIDKLRALTIFQLAVLEIWARAYWHLESARESEQWVSEIAIAD